MNGAVNGLDTRRWSGSTLPSLRTTRQLNLTWFKVVPPRLPYWPTSCGCWPAFVTTTLGSVMYGAAGAGAAPAAVALAAIRPRAAAAVGGAGAWRGGAPRSGGAC